MSRLRFDKNRGEVSFKCPGCGCTHTLNILRTSTPRWDWNGSESKPTLKPSINFSAKGRDGVIRMRCHSYVEAGRIRFLPDSTHSNAGKVLDLYDMDSI